MAYRFRRKESVGEAVARIGASQIDGALTALRAQGKRREEQIYEARKRIKKVRALLRLAAGDLGDAFDAENSRLREIAHALGPFRDAEAMVETFDKLREKYKAETRGLDTVRRGLLVRKTTAERRQGTKGELEEAARGLAQVRQRIRKTQVRRDGFEALAEGLERGLRQGAAAMDKAYRQPRPERFHEWRKRVKDSWYHMRLLRDTWPEVMGGYEEALKALEDKLGQDHNLNVLAEKVKSEPEIHGSAAQIDTLCKYVERFQKELREEAEPAGARLYAEKPGRLVRRVERWWSVWHRDSGR